MLIVANWKAYIEELARAKKLLSVSRRLAKATAIDIVLAPPAPFIGVLAAKNKPSAKGGSASGGKVAFAAQDISVTTGGAATGEATAQAYVAIGAAYGIIGHSERRARGDTDAIVAEKLSHALAHGMKPILCVGELERDSEGRYLSFIREELTTAFNGVVPKMRAEVIIAYEPIWAIGKDAAAAIRPQDLSEMTLYVRKVLAELSPGKNTKGSPVLYGGSVEPDNIRDLAAGSGVDGFLIGHASVEPRVFAELVKRLS